MKQATLNIRSLKLSFFPTNASKTKPADTHCSIIHVKKKLYKIQQKVDRVEVINIERVVLATFLLRYQFKGKNVIKTTG